MQKNISFFIAFTAFLGLFNSYTRSNPTFLLTEQQKLWFNTMEKPLLDSFKQLTNLDDEEFKVVVSTIIDMKKQCFNRIFQLDKSSTEGLYHHDERIPKHIMEKIYKTVEKHGISPYSVNIELGSGSDALEGYAGALDYPSISATTTKQNKIVCFTVNYTQKPTLYIYKDFYDVDNNTFESFLLHEFGHFVEAHSGQRAILGHILSERNIPEKERDNFFKRFTCIIELIADQRLTIGNKSLVERMMTKYHSPAVETEIIKKFGSSSIDYKHLQIDYDAGYPKYSTRWVALKMMQTALRFT